MKKVIRQPKQIEVKGAKVHNLKNIDVNVPLHGIVGIAGVSGSGKSSLALGVLYAEGSRRYLESLSTYTRRRMTGASRANVEEVRYIPASLALHQRPSAGDIRSTFGTRTELLNSLRLMFSRLASHRCPNGHYVAPSLSVAAEQEIVCQECGAHFYGPGAEMLAFNSDGACEACGGTGVIRTVDKDSLVPNKNLTLDEGAVAPWNKLMWSLMTQVAHEMGVRTNVPFRDLTNKEKNIVFNGPAEKKHILYKAKNSNTFAEMDFTYFNATYTVENALSKVKDEKGMKRVEKFLKEETCPTCQGTRLSDAARAPRIDGINLAEATAMTLKDLIVWVEHVPSTLPKEMRPMAKNICESFLSVAGRLVDLGLSYLTLDRSTTTLSNGELQRTQLARSVRNRTTGVLYVLDEPSIGLHPSNIDGLADVMRDLIADGNSIVMVDHDAQILNACDWIIEMGPGAGLEGGTVITEGTVSDVEHCKTSLIGSFLSGEKDVLVRTPCNKTDVFSRGAIMLETDALHTVKPLKIYIPKGRLSVVTGVSGSGKTTIVLESLVPALQAQIYGTKLPSHVRSIDASGVEAVKVIDASPIGINVRSTVATYTGIHDALRKLFAKTEDAQRLGYKASDFSYNTGSLRCPTCDGTGSISLDVQFLPDVDIPCPACQGSRYAHEAWEVSLTNTSGESATLPEIMSMEVETALEFFRGVKSVYTKLKMLSDLGLGYLTLGEQTPSLSGGEAQRLKLSSEMGRAQIDAVFVFDEPTIGLHPLDIQTLLTVFERLIKQGATVVVIEHDLDVMRNADWLVDMGPGGGVEGGRVVVAGQVSDVVACAESVTGKYL